MAWWFPFGRLRTPGRPESSMRLLRRVKKILLNLQKTFGKDKKISTILSLTIEKWLTPAILDCSDKELILERSLSCKKHKEFSIRN